MTHLCNVIKETIYNLIIIIICILLLDVLVYMYQEGIPLFHYSEHYEYILGTGTTVSQNLKCIPTESKDILYNEKS